MAVRTHRLVVVFFAVALIALWVGLLARPTRGRAQSGPSAPPPPPPPPLQPARCGTPALYDHNESLPGAVTVTYSAGWNLVAVPMGTVIAGNAGAFFTLQAGDYAGQGASYEVIPNGSQLQAGRGYWAYFSSPTTATLSAKGPQRLTLQLPAALWVMIGNPFTVPLYVPDSSGLCTFDPVSGSCCPFLTTLAPGRGAWALSENGGSLTLFAAPPPPPPAPPPPTTGPATAAPPAAPADLVATAIDSNTIELDWSYQDGSADGAQIYDGLTGDFITSVDASTATYTLVDLVPGSQYCAVVYAYNAAGLSDPSNVACADTPP